MSERPNQFGSKGSKWRVPDSFYAVLDKEFGLTDGCAFVEPPNDKKIIDEVLTEAYKRARDGEMSVVAFLPSDTGAGWFHKHAMLASEMIFIQGRVRLVDGNGNLGKNPIAPSLLLIYRVNDWPPAPRVRIMKRLGRNQGHYLAKAHAIKADPIYRCTLCGFRANAKAISLIYAAVSFGPVDIDMCCPICKRALTEEMNK